MTAGTLTRETLLSLFHQDAHASIQNALDEPHIIGLAVYEDDEAAGGRRRATPTQHAAPPETDRHGGRLIGVYLKDRMKLALSYLREHPGTSAYAAARRYGVSTQAVYDALKRAKKQALKDPRPVCPCCGQAIQKNG